MKSLLELLPCAVLVGAGASLAALGFRIVRFHTLTVSVTVFAGVGCAAGAWVGSLPLIAVLSALGAAAGYFLEKVLFYVYVALSAAVGGSIVGVVLAVIVGSSHPWLLVVACAVGCAVIALLDARMTTISWTSTAGSAVMTLGVLVGRMSVAQIERLAVDSSFLRAQAVAAGILFVAFAVAGVLFQGWSTREKPAAPPQPVRAPTH